MRDEMCYTRIMADIAAVDIKPRVLESVTSKIIVSKNKFSFSFQKYLALSLFSGAGGLSEGFVNAGFDIVAHIEMDKDACDTLITRSIYRSLLKRNKLLEYKNYVLGLLDRDKLITRYDLQKENESVICSKIGKGNYKNLINEVRKRLNGQKLDVIIGGPPCQAYSQIGRARDVNNMRGDERNFLYKYYIEFLKALKPKIFIFENVPGLLSAGGGKYLKDMRQLMKKAGYKTDYRIINAADFGVPQNRKRIILVGWRRGSGFTAYPDFLKVNRKYLVKDFMSDLPKLQAGKGLELEKFISKNILLKDLGIVEPKFNFLMGHVARHSSSMDLEIYRRAVAEKKKGKNIKYYELPSSLQTHKNKNGFLDRFKVVDYMSRGSHTVVAHIAKDGNFYIHPDVRQNRSLTLREVARLQTFPDSYKFEGSRTSQFKQVGNAVPPLLSKQIAKVISKKLKNG